MINLKMKPHAHPNPTLAHGVSGAKAGQTSVPSEVRKVCKLEHYKDFAKVNQKNRIIVFLCAE
jgi:hypothetical protein